MALWLTQPLTEMSTGNLHMAKGWLVHKADNPTAIYEPIVIGDSPSHNSMGIHNLLQEYIYFLLFLNFSMS
jgi:hypothetical protein